MAKGREARASDDLSLGNKRADHWLKRSRAEQHGLFAAARVEQAVGEDVAAFRIGGELRLIKRNECQIGFRRHRLNRAKQPTRTFRLDPLFPSNQRNVGSALDRADPVINFARQEPQRKTNRAR